MLLDRIKIHALFCTYLRQHPVNSLLSLDLVKATLNAGIMITKPMFAVHSCTVAARATKTTIQQNTLAVIIADSPEYTKV